MRNSGISRGYFFCFRDGGHGVPVNSFGLVQTTSSGANWAHYALRAVNGVRLYALRVLGRPTQFGLGKTDPLVDSMALSDVIHSQGTLQLPVDTVALAETITLTGKPASSETVQLSEDTITFAASLSGGTIHLGSTLNVAQNMTIDGSALASKITRPMRP